MDKDTNTIIHSPVLALPEVVLFPRTKITLFVSDPLIIEMLKEAIKFGNNIVITQSKNPFVNRIPFSKQSISSFYQVGTIGRCVYLDEESTPGLFKVIIKGVERVKILEIVQNLPYPTYEIEMMSEVQVQKKTLTSVASVRPDSRIEKLANLLHNWGERNIQDSLDRENFFANLDNITHLVYKISSHIVMDPNIKQFLLESCCLEETIQNLSILFPHEFMNKEDPMATNALIKFEELEKLNLIAN